MPGRPRKATKLHVLQGTFRPSRHKGRVNEPKIDRDLGNPPDYFNVAQCEEWARVRCLPQVNYSHRPTAIHHCILYERMVQDARNERTMTASERQTFHSIQMQMGWTAAAQSKVSSAKEEKQVNPFAEFGS